MRRILSELTQNVGVRGAAVITPDGMVVASALTGELNDESVAALGASLVLRAVHALERVGVRGIDRTVIVASRGKIILIDAGLAYLVVVTDLGINLDLTMLDISGAAYKLRKASRLEV